MPLHFATASSCQQINFDRPPAFNRYNFPCTLRGHSKIGNEWATTNFTHEIHSFKLTIQNNHNEQVAGQIRYFTQCATNPNTAKTFEPTAVSKDIVIGANQTYSMKITSNCTPSLFNNASWKPFITNKHLESYVTYLKSVNISAGIGALQPFNTLDVSVQPA